MNQRIKSFPNIIFLSVMVFLVVVLQYYLLSGALTLGFKPDDWVLYFGYKLLGQHPWDKISSVWSERGIYTTYQVYYLGLLDSLVGLNYRLIQQISLILKVLASLSLYPLILIIFKNKLLAFLTVLLFCINPASTGPLEFAVKGSDYLAIFWMNLFLIVYYLIIAEKIIGLKYYFLSSALFILSLGFSPIRIFPLIIIPSLIELFLMLRKFDLVTIKKSFIRLSVLYSPIILFSLSTPPVSFIGDAHGPVGVLNGILEGRWYLFLSPISGLGYTFITDDYLGKIFGSITASSLKSYLFFLMGGPTIICGIVTATVCWSQISKHKMVFFILTMLLNFTFQVLIYFIAFHHLKLPFALHVNYDSANLYSVIFGGYIGIVGFMIFLDWLNWGKGNKISAGFWMGCAFLFVFSFLTWVFAPLGTGFSGTSYYLVVASIGSSLMLGAFLVSIYDKIKLKRVKFLAFLPFLILIPIFVMSSNIIHQKFLSLNRDGRGAQGQILMQDEARRVLKNYKAGDFALVYFDTSDITGNGPFYSEGFLTSFPFFMHFRDNKIVNGCIGVIYEDSKMVELRKFIQVRNGIRGFDYPALCIDEEKGGFKNSFFTTDQFYAFKIKDKKLINIKEIVLNKLNFD